MKQTRVISGLLLAFALVTPAFAQNVSEATGTVKDRDGNAVQGAVVTFFAKSKPDVPYTGKTNKKGRYFVAGMFTGKEGDMWGMSLAVEGYSPVEVRVESRTVNRVLVGDIMTAKLKPGQTPPEIVIRPLGKAQVDWTVAPSEVVEQEFQAAAQAAAQAAVQSGDEGEGEGGDTGAPKKDPWVEALTLASDGALEDSLAYFDEAIGETPDDPERVETYAKVLYRLERLDEAEAQARRAVELDATRVDSQMVLFSVLESKGDLAAARAALETAHVALPEDARILGRLGHVAQEMGDGDAALAAYRKLAEVNPHSAEAWLSLANALADAGELEESEAAYQKVVDLDPENAYQTYYNLGALIIKRSNRSEGDTRRAIDAFRRALEIKPDYSLACQELAYALIGIGDQAGALETLQSYVSNNPKAPESARMKALIQTLQK